MQTISVQPGGLSPLLCNYEQNAKGDHTPLSFLCSLLTAHGHQVQIISVCAACGGGLCGHQLTEGIERNYSVMGGAIYLSQYTAHMGGRETDEPLAVFYRGSLVIHFERGHIGGKPLLSRKTNEEASKKVTNFWWRGY